MSSLLGLTYHSELHISSTSQAYQQFLWTKAHIISRIRDRFIARASDADDSANACEFNGDRASARNWRLQRDAFLAKADSELGGWGPTTAQLDALIENERRQACIRMECQRNGDALQEALSLEKPKQEKSCRDALAKLEPEAAKLHEAWIAGMKSARIPLDGTEEQLKMVGLWDAFQRALKAAAR
ncbi:hypothetical protein P8935_14490 [Telmatobacter sp. DSM 110680]|uniref:Lysozyme inhibitor LprI N-terminal domain-containing protein n=1 Tax=Telmatobacter sp. DSM 110680 TaxID=3036704 RepID=A0AAU7DEL5_9BACT